MKAFRSGKDVDTTPRIMAESDSLLATASGENVKLWSMPNLDLQSIRPCSGIVHCACWSPNNSLLATSVEENQINVANLKGDTTIDLSTAEEQLCLCFSTNSRYLLSGSVSGVAQIWDLKHKTSRKSFKDQKSSILCATFNYNDTIIASGGSNGDAMLHNVANGTYTGLLRLPGTQAIRGIKFSNFLKQILATASDDSAVNIWDISTKQIVKEYAQEHRMPASGVSFSPANDMLMCSFGIDKKIVFYDVVGKKTIKTITTDAPLTSADFYHNGSTLAVGASTGKLYLFDLRAGSTPTKTTSADKTSIKTVTFQKLITKSSSKGATRRGSNSSIGSTSSNKSREASSDFKDMKTSIQQEEKEAVPKGDNINIAVPNIQPVSSLFSPLRGTESGTTESKSDDTDIVPMETMRAELLKKSSILSGMYPERKRANDSSTAQPLVSPLRAAEKPNQHSSDDAYDVRSKSQSSKAKHSLAKSSSDSRFPSQNGRLETSSETSGITEAVVSGKHLPADFLPQEGTRHDSEQSANGLHNFQVDFIRNMIEDAIEDTRESMHRSFLHLQAEMLRQFHLQQEEIRSMVEQLSPNQQLIEENARLKEEIRRIKTNF